MDQNIITILNKFPFLSYGEMKDDKYIGIIQNSDIQLISIYVLESIPTQELRMQFLNYGMEWWYGSNREVPINIFLKERFALFRPYLKHFNAKDFKHLYGPCVSLAETMARRDRKRKITLIRHFEE